MLVAEKTLQLRSQLLTPLNVQFLEYASGISRLAASLEAFLSNQRAVLSEVSEL
jgi:hypothetical protein